MQIYFIGAGPGDPELITVKGQRILGEADIVIYAGSLVNPALLSLVKQGAQVYNSASMTLEEVITVMLEGVQNNKMVVRLHTGDPSIYGAIQEQMDELNKHNIEYKVIPGVSSFLATAAALKQEYTLPDVSQTVIVTRIEGRTPVPEKESLASLASHNATMCIFLSVHMIEEVVTELIKGGYTETTPIAIVQKASWPEEKIVRGTLGDIAQIIKENDIMRTALIVVGQCLFTSYSLSRLYAPEFAHMYRDASK